MCGIAGIYNIKDNGPISVETLANMLSVIRHRGPDESGIYADSRIGLGHVRLSIIGIDNGIQPIANEDKSLFIVYNGEAFNYIELKEELTAKGHLFTTETDTEVVLHLYEEYGPHCLDKINGQFALAIWNLKKRELFLARDRVGIRPLYYTKADGKFLFASEMKALFMDPAVGRTLDPKSLFQTFAFWTTLNSNTIFRGVYQLPPGHYMVVKEDQMDSKRYWEIPYHTPDERWSGSFEEAREELLNILKDAIRIRLRADVPVGTYLSGGLDSSFITSMVSKNFNNRLQTFSMAFKENRYDESLFQKEMVRFLGVDCNEVLIENKSIHDYLPEVIWHCELPLLRTAPVPLYLLSNLVRKNNFKVVLTGEGSDEVFAGYNIYKEAKVRAFCGKFPESKHKVRFPPE